MFIIEIALVVVLAIAVSTDVKTGKIKNWLTLPAAAFGPLLHLALGGRNQALLSLAGICVMVVISALILSLKLLGAGDAKLLVAVGALAGLPFAVKIVLYSAIAGGVFALIVMVKRRIAGSVIRQLLGWARLRFIGKVNIPIPTASNTRLPYSIAIATGTAVAMLVR